jgi:iron(II)-dependent oxidoreductase
MHLIMAWDRQFYDHTKGGYQIEGFVKRGRQLYGGDAVIGLWPNWPMLGLDQKNQWDQFRSMPGGTEKLKEIAQMLRRYSTRFFISYNPWDESTRWEDHHAGMADMIRATTADGVVLDTEGKSTPERQQAADQVRPGVVMYSEGMAVPRDMPGIVSGRVHNALYYPPMLNLNKFIRPDFAIFRVAELFKERIRREYALSYFNGYGTELNIFRPGRPDWIEEDYRFWGRTLRILRENTSNFVVQDFTPLYPSYIDGIYINHWPTADKEIFTIFSLIPEGYSGPLFLVEPREGYHLVDLWHHEEIEPDTVENQLAVPVKIEGFSKYWLGTNNEGAVGGIAYLPEVLSASRSGDELSFSATDGDYIQIWPGNPSYGKEEQARRFGIHPQKVRLMEHFGKHEGKFVLQLFKNEELLDQKTVFIAPGTARLISQVEHTPKATSTPEGMVKIPAGRFRMKVTFGDNFIPNPVDYPKEEIQLPAFYMDKHPVTNQQFKTFLEETHYQPLDTTNFLRHWVNGQIPEGQEQYPVIYVSYEDAQAYARWSGKRLPTEIEWQYAAQTPDLREWPWSKEARVKREQQFVTNTLTVSKLQVDPELCNTGEGELYPVGSYPKGVNPYGLEDLVGCVWQLTNDVYDNGTNYFCILKGGSYYLPASSWWYVEGGPRELTYSQKLLRVSPGFERNATVGFRCIKDHSGK